MHGPSRDHDHSGTQSPSTIKEVALVSLAPCSEIPETLSWTVKHPSNKIILISQNGNLGQSSTKASRIPFMEVLVSWRAMGMC